MAGLPVGTGDVPVIAILGILAGLQVAAPQIVTDCRACDRDLTEIVRFGDMDGPGAIGRVAWVAAMSDGRWAMTDYQDPRVKVYGRDGSYATHFGGKGQGPGEFVLPAQIWSDTAGHLNVMDLDLLRRTVLTRSGDLARVIRLDAGFTTVASYADGRMVTGALLPTASGEMALLHVVDGEGRRVRSLGPSVTLEAARARSTFRIVAPSGDSAVWVGLPDRYELHLISLEGVPLRTLRRETDLFKPHDGRIGLGPDDGPPRSRFADIQEQPNGDLWVLFRVADPEWRAAFIDGSDPYGRPRKVVGDPSMYWDGIVEVIDVRTGTVKAKARTDLALSWFVGPELVAGEAYSALGVPQVVVFELRDSG